jgi:hypothetical protein
MTNVTIKETQNPTILKFEDFITQNESFEFKKTGKSSPLAQQLFYLPLCEDNIHIRKLQIENITLE